MNVLKIITILNWIVTLLIGLLVAAETFFPTEGGDAAGRGMGQAIYYLAVIALVVLLGLNLLPYNWAKFTAFGLVALPVLFVVVAPTWRNWKRNIAYRIEAAQPIFADPARDRLARAIRKGEPEKLAALLKTPVPQLHAGGELLAYAISEASSTTYKPQEKLQCVRLLFQAGARLDSIGAEEVPVYIAVADVGNAALLRLLLEQGADANANLPYCKRPVIFEAIAAYQEPEASVQALLDFGADPNATAVLDDDQGAVSPLWRAAEMGRWGVCVALLQKGADRNFKTADGISWRSFVEAAGQDFSADGYSTRADFERLKQVLR